MANPLRIRAHHLLCFLSFHGLGYSPGFVAEMGRVVAELCSDASLPIALVTECDIICAACPHQREGRCQKSIDSFKRVKTMDRQVLRLLGLEAGNELYAFEALAKVKDRILVPDMVNICCECEWLELGHCVEALRRLNLKSGVQQAL